MHVNHKEQIDNYFKNFHIKLLNIVLYFFKHLIKKINHIIIQMLL